MPKIAVYDADNKARLLGFLQINRTFFGNRLNMAVMPPISARAMYRNPFDRPVHDVMQKVTFKREWLTKNEQVSKTDWFEEISLKRQAILTTDASLSLLKDMPEFQLPQHDDADTAEFERVGKEAAKNADFY